MLHPQVKQPHPTAVALLRLPRPMGRTSLQWWTQWTSPSWRARARPGGAGSASGDTFRNTAWLTPTVTVTVTWRIKRVSSTQRYTNVHVMFFCFCFFFVLRFTTVMSQCQELLCCNYQTTTSTCLLTQITDHNPNTKSDSYTPKPWTQDRTQHIT